MEKEFALYDIKRIVTTTDEEKVNYALSHGWILLKIIEQRDEPLVDYGTRTQESYPAFVIGTTKPKKPEEINNSEENNND